MNAPDTAPWAGTEGDGLLRTVLGTERPPPFALLVRSGGDGPGRVDVLTGEVSAVPETADIPLPDLTGRDGGAERHDVLALIPYRQITERGFGCNDDEAPLLVMTVTGQETMPVSRALDLIPDLPVALSGGRFDVGDEDYAETVRRVVKEVIGEGEGANFVIRRSFVADIGEYTPHKALAVFRRLLRVEVGAYWTFVVHTGDRTFVGATPERHVTLRRGLATMNPISGTYRYPPSGPSLPEVMDFLANQKESDELYMVLDEELKMMTRICEPGVHVSGPHLKQMARLAHTEYFIEGETRRDVRDILRETMFAPTVTGSPLENACRVIQNYETGGRGYYSGVLALVGSDASGERTLDSSILIRTADIDDRGRMAIGVGSTLVRHSDPVSEVAETHAKAAGLLAAVESRGAGGLDTHPDIRDALVRRNANIADFWLLGEDHRGGAEFPGLAGCRTLIVDAEDTFTSMLDHQCRDMGMSVTVVRHDDVPSFDGYDFVVLGPGPGDPRDPVHSKMANMRAAARALLAERRPFLAVCLSHQVLSAELGFEIRRRPSPNQGVQKEVDLFGDRQRVGFYNTFAAWSEADAVELDGVGAVEVCRDPDSGEVHALRGPRFSSLQFHAESVLTQNGPHILGSFIGRTLNA
ncbi:anthranilate synthase family protein [Nocardiopsis sp. HUAS JQ3]|uniref:anthranilate synthase family protein n=1 Tax=Nocardiopsis sp. HUAS JQ3 TaxID=3061629 RepID=UPI0023A9DFA4|nr:anthranilate synthase family protein [Nocardiopsis sp. HUAS JQ3]WDZ91561.1 anthranilate synthase family protein [Nocardiopsis sp. HUAS JQ3]